MSIFTFTETTNSTNPTLDLNIWDQNSSSLGKFNWLGEPPKMPNSKKSVLESIQEQQEKPAYIRHYPISGASGGVYTYRLSEHELAQREKDGYLFLPMCGDWFDVDKYEILVKKLKLREAKGYHTPWVTFRGKGFRLDDPKNFDQED